MSVQWRLFTVPEHMHVARRSYTSLYLFKGYIRCIRWTGAWLSQLMPENLFWDPLAWKHSLLILSSSVCVVPGAWMPHTFTDMFADMKYSTAMVAWGTISRESVMKPRSVCVCNIDWDVGCEEQVSGLIRADKSAFWFWVSPGARGWRQWLNNSWVFHSFQTAGV